VIYALISFCAWRGLIELITRPYHWHKTPHGLMKSEGGVGDLRGVAVPDTKPSEAERPEPGHR
jgi:hypothetical protein